MGLRFHFLFLLFVGIFRGYKPPRQKFFEFSPPLQRRGMMKVVHRMEVLHRNLSCLFFTFIIL